MTISTTIYKKTYTGDGADTTFDFNFQILSQTHLTVEIINSSSTLQTQILGVDYIVSGTGNSEGETNYDAGTVTFTSAPSSTDTIIIRRSTPKTQTTDYKENDRFPAETHEESLDKLTLQIQDIQEQLDRCFKRDYVGEDTSDFTLPNPVANYYIRFNSAGDGLEAVSNTGTIGLDNLVDDPSPQLDGNLDVNNNQIVSTSNGNISITPDGTGEVRINSATMTVENKIVHLGDTDTYISFDTNSLDIQTGGSSRLDISNTGVRLGGANSRVTTILSENDMVSNSATALATQNSIKTYIDTTTVNSGNSILQANLDVATYDIVTTSANRDIDIDPHGSGDINLTTDSGGNVNISSANDIDLQSDIVLVGQDIRHKGDLDNKIIFGTDTLDIQTGGSSRLDVSNTGVRFGASNSRITTALDEDTMSSDSNTALATQQSIKAYVDNKSASQSEMEAASSSTVYASPAVLQYFPGVVKAWLIMTVQTSTITIQDSYNITSVTYNSPPNYRYDILFDEDLSGTDYCVFINNNIGSLTNYLTKATTGFTLSTTSNLSHELQILILGDI